MLENLSDAECALFAITQDPSGIDLAELCVYAPIDAETDGCFRARPYQVPWWRCTDTLQIDQCFPGGSLVLTERGQVPISQVTTNDRVMTHKGNWKRVLSVFDRGNQDFVKVSGVGHPGFITTADHKFYSRSVANRKISAPAWVGASDLKTGAERYSQWATLQEIQPTNPSQIVGRYRPGNSNDLTSAHFDSIFFWWMYGLYLAEGSTSSSYGKGGKINRVTFSVHVKEVNQVEGYLRDLGFNFNTWVNQNVANIVVNSLTLAQWLNDMGGKGASSKGIHPSVFGMPYRVRDMVLRGAMFGDGYKRGGTEVYTTVSRALAFDIKQLASTLGMQSSVAIRNCAGTSTILGRQINVRDSYAVSVCLESTKARVKFDGKYGWSRVLDVVPYGSGQAYDLEVEDDSSYVVEGVVVHNCSRSVGKSKSIQIRALAFPFLYPKQEMVVTAPELNHLQPITGIIEEAFDSCRLGREMLQKSRSRISHRPFIMNFANGARILGKIPQRDGKGVKGCAAEGTLVLTATGMQPIEDVKIGDSIFTHSGKWSEVKQITTDINDCYEVKGQGSYPLVVSSDHRFYGRTESGEVTWVDVEDLMEEKFKWATPTEFPSLPVEDLKFYGTATRFKTVNADSFWWLVGRYIADGHLTESKKTGKEKRVIWSVHPKDQDEVAKRLDDLSLSYRIVKRAHSTADLVVLNSAPLHDWLEKHFSRRSHTKTLPSFVYGMDEVMRRNLLKGYLSGDGSWSAEKNRWTAGTCSHRLAVGMQLLGQSVGFRVNVSKVQPKVESIMGVKLKNEPRPSWRIMLYHDYMHEGWRFAPVKSVTPVGKKRVFNLITDDHSYMTGSIMSHNIHPIWLEQDEAQDYPHAGWTEIIETLRQGMRGATWRAHGVTRGVQDDFYKRSADPKTEWTVHRIYAMHSPEWSDEVRRKKIAEYGSRDDPDYRRNVLGEHGDATNPLFVLHRLMRVIDTENESEYNTDEYSKTRITAEIINDAGGDVEAVLDARIPKPDPKIKTFWGGMDVGYTNDPSEILIFGEYQIDTAERKLREKFGKKTPSEGQSNLKLLARVQLVRVRASDQVRVISWLFNNFQGMKSFGMDATGNGLPLFQDMQDAAVGYVDRIRGYKFGSKIVVGFDESVEFDEMIEDPADEAAVESIVEIYATDVLRTMVDQGRIWLPFDDSLLASFQGQMQVVKSDMDMYGKKRRYSSGNFHVLDAARMAALAWKQYPIEKLLGNQVQEDVIDVPMYDDFLEGW